MTLELMTDPCMLLYSQGIQIGGVFATVRTWRRTMGQIVWKLLFLSGLTFSNMCIHVVLAENPSGLQYVNV